MSAVNATPVTNYAFQWQIQAAPNVWSRLKSWSNIVNPRAYGQIEDSRTLLHGFSGSLEGGEMLLVIGKPGSGCTTFLKALANMRDEYKDTTGVLTYGGRPADERDPDPVKPTFCGTCPSCLWQDAEMKPD